MPVAHTISILIITYNRADDLLALLKSLSQLTDYQACVAEVLILNNASTTDYSLVTDYIGLHPEMKVRYIWSDENLGVARGRNRLMAAATGSLMLTIDDDMEFPDAASLVTMRNLFNQPLFAVNNTGIITLRVIYFSTKELQRSVFPHKKFDKFIRHNQFLTLYFAGGANLMKREVFLKCGALPEDFFYGMEEYDFSYRVIDAGYSIGYDNSITIEHKESPEGRQPSHQKLQMQWVNKSKVAWRYLPKIYFYSTAVMWSLQYVKLVKGHWHAYLAGWNKIFRIPQSEPRKPISPTALSYLRKVEARLWF